VRFVRVVNSRNETLLARAKWCDSFASRLRGLTFRRTLAPDEGLVLVEARAGTASTSIHMFFVRFDIAAIWLSEERRVVHKVLARAWHPYYASPVPARYVLEGSPSLLERVSAGEELKFMEGDRAH